MKDDEIDLSERAGLVLDTFWSHVNSFVLESDGIQSCP